MHPFDDLVAGIETLAGHTAAAVDDGGQARVLRPISKCGKVGVKGCPQRIGRSHGAGGAAEVVQQHLACGVRIEPRQKEGRVLRLSGEKRQPVLQAERNIGPAVRRVE